VYTEDLAIDDGGKDQEIKYMTTGLPDRGITILHLTLFIESVHLGDLPGFVVTSNEHYSVRVPVDCG
jgi:hypothetical protein